MARNKISPGVNPCGTCAIDWALSIIILANLPAQRLENNQTQRSQAATKRRPQHRGHGGFTETTEEEGLGSVVGPRFCTLFVFSVASANLGGLCVETSFLCVPRGSSVFVLQRHREEWETSGNKK